MSSNFDILWLFYLSFHNLSDYNYLYNYIYILNTKEYFLMSADLHLIIGIISKQKQIS